MSLSISNKKKSLAEELPIEQARVREILGHYIEIGPPGAFGAAMIQNDLRKAEEAVASGNVVDMIKAYTALQETK
jgi:hypothetical protein